MAIHLHNTLTNRKEPLEPIEAGKLSMYHCGPTVYSSPHIGNFRAFLLADLMRRFFEDQGFEVKQVMNITDVGHMTDDDEDRGEDKMELAAESLKLDPWAIAKKYEDEFLACMGLLGFRMPHHLPRATDHIQEMGAIIEDLLEKGIAYQVNGNVYFDISRFPAYGELSNKVLDELEEGARIAVNKEKRDPRDFALWKTDDKHLMQWPGPFKGGARGFPGWHIECSAMSMKYLGESFDIHTGGEDNLFPHHECEIAQSEASTGKQFVRTWLHVKHLMVEGQKMSKSLGNFFTVMDVLNRGYSGEELRYTIQKVQYRQSLNFTWAGLDDARASINRVREAWGKVLRIRDGQTSPGADKIGDAVEKSHADFTAALSDDLNTSVSLAAVFALVSAINKADPDMASATAAAAAFTRYQDVLGVYGAEPAEVDVSDDLLAKAKARHAARKAKDFETADRLRDEIAAAGYRVVDTSEGPRIERN